MHIIKFLPKLILLLLIFVLSVFISCARNLCNPYSVSLIIPDNFSVEKDLLEQAVLKTLHVDSSSSYTLEVCVYSYSSGREIFSYADNPEKDVKRSVSKAYMELLVKVKSSGKLIQTRFIKAEGNSRDDLFSNIALKIKSDLCG